MADKILLVDDDSMILELLRLILRRTFDVDVATGPRGALRKLKEAGPYAVVVSDIEMPGMNGIEFLGRVKEKWPATVRIVFSSKPGYRDAAESIDLFRFLHKPDDLGDLEKTLDEAVFEFHRRYNGGG